MKRTVWLLFFSVFGSLFLANSVWAVGVGVKPKKIDLAVTVGQKIETEILVVNVLSEPTLYQLYPDTFDQEIILVPADFILSGNGQQVVKVIVEMKNPGYFTTSLSVLARPVGAANLLVGSAVKVPVVIQVSGVARWRWFLGIILGACFLGYFVVKLKQSKLKIN